MVEISPYDLIASRDAALEEAAQDSKRECPVEEVVEKETLFRNHAAPSRKLSKILADDWWNSTVADIAKNYSTYGHDLAKEANTYGFSPLMHQHATQGKDFLKADSHKSHREPNIYQYKVENFENSAVMSLSSGPSIGKTPLFVHVENEEWDLAALWAEAFVEETKTWVVIRGDAITPTSRTSHKVTCLRLPIHEALIRKAPYPVIRSFLNAYPDATKETDENGRLPLHLASYYGADSDCVMDLITVFPASLDIPDRDGMKPLDLVPESALLEILAKGFERCSPIKEAADSALPFQNEKVLSNIIVHEEKRKKSQALFSHQLEEMVKVTEVNRMASSNNLRAEALEMEADSRVNRAIGTVNAREEFVAGTKELEENSLGKKNSKHISKTEKESHTLSIPTYVSGRISAIRSKISQVNGELRSTEGLEAQNKTKLEINHQADGRTADSLEQRDVKDERDTKVKAEPRIDDQEPPLKQKLMVITGVDDDLMLHYIEKISAALLKTDLSEISRLQKENRLLEDELKSALQKVKEDRESSAAHRSTKSCATSSTVLQEGMEPSFQDQQPFFGKLQEGIDNDLVLCYAEKIANAISRADNKEIERLREENRLITTMWKELESTTDSFEKDCHSLHRDFFEKMKQLRTIPPEHMENNISLPVMAASDDGQQGEENFPFNEKNSDMSRKTNNYLIYQAALEGEEYLTMEMDYTISTETKELPQQMLISEEAGGFLAVVPESISTSNASFPYHIQNEVNDVNNTMEDNRVIKQIDSSPFCCILSLF